jgi:hypothetical protein
LHGCYGICDTFESLVVPLVVGGEVSRLSILMMDWATDHRVFIYEVLWFSLQTGTETNWMDECCGLRFSFSLPRFENLSPIPFPACSTTFVLRALAVE